ncbi:lysozyme [Serratia liquefaciens]|uniref:Lysozyme n=1 Tax=Serratia liquefaciens TaxID=614 RepID=A0A515D5L7_SERLI|nr:lysozyme [Serratia liquefaciens]QDL35698.1 lysozyme [Serratia liquefaciens]
MKISEKGIALIKAFEGLNLRAYLCPAHIWTIGYGHTRKVMPGDTVTPDEADTLLRQDITDAERAVKVHVSVPLTQGQFDSLVSFVFNLGVGNFRTSTLLKKLNAGDYDGTAQEFGRWIHAGGKALPGLVRRREAERVLFLK